MKKALSAVSILLVIAVFSGVFGAVGVNAEGAYYTQKDVKAYVFTLESTKTVRCLFRSDLPDVPYIEPTDYLNVIYTDQFTVDRGFDGTYTVTNAYGETMIIDPEKETIVFKNYDSFISCIINQEGASVNIDFIEPIGNSCIIEPGEVIIDLSTYHMNIAENGGRVYIPLPVIAAMFSVMYNNAVYLDGCICFVHTMDPGSYYENLDQSSRYQELTRSEAMAEFNYYSLCLYMDCFFGKPSNMILTEEIEEKGLDRALDEFDEVTPTVKQLLLSTDMIEYFDGLVIFSYYCFDGGHTVLFNSPINSTDRYKDQLLPKVWVNHVLDPDDELGSLTLGYYSLQVNMYEEKYTPYHTRVTEYKKYEDEIVKEWENTGSFMMIHKDTAVYVFDSFELETPAELNEALDIAKERGVKNFVLDDSCNGGGYVAAFQYICALITNGRFHDGEFTYAKMIPLTGSVNESTFALDLNLDGKFDDADKAFSYDFNFAILTSKCAFSCGNELPVFASQLGVMIIGEPSGGGSCCVTERYLADGLAYPTSDILKSVLPDGGDVDLGAPVDYLLVTAGEEGNNDYTGMYDLDYIDEIVSGFYKTVKFVDHDGTVISEIKYRPGEKVIVPADPERDADDEYSYVFAGWGKEITAADDDAVYTATYEQRARFVPGDINGDGDVDNKDVVLLFRYASGGEANVNVTALDVNGDGSVDNKDVVVLFRFVSGGDVELSSVPYVPAVA